MLAFLVMIMVYSVVFFVFGLMLTFIQLAVDHESQFLAQIAGHGFGAFAGMLEAARFLNTRFFAGYPARAFAVIFIAFTGILLGLTLTGLAWKAADPSIDDSIGPSARIVEASGSIVAILACWWVFWKNRGDRARANPQHDRHADQVTVR